MIVTIIESTDDFKKLEPEWNQLLEQSALASPFLTWEWQFNWWENYHKKYSKNVSPFIITARDTKHNLLMILPLFVRQNKRYGLSYSQLKLMGTDYESSDYLDIICAENFGISGFLRALQDEKVQNVLPSIDMVTFNNLLKESNLFRLQEHQPAGFSKNPGLKTTSTCPYLPLPESEEALLKSVSKNMKSSLRRTRNKINKDEAFRIYLVEDSAELPGLVKDLFDLHRLRFTDQKKATKFIYEVRGVFHTKMAGIFLKRGILKLFVVKHQNKAVGLLYCLEYKKRLMYVQAGFNPGFAKYALGNQLILFAINHAIEGHCTEFDFMRGSEPYKYKWTDKVRYLYQLEYALSNKGKIIFNLEKLVDKGKSIIKTIIRKN